MQTHEIQTRPEQQGHKPPGAPGPAGRQACQSGTGGSVFFSVFSGFSIFFDLACLALFLLNGMARLYYNSDLIRRRIGADL